MNELVKGEIESLLRRNEAKINDAERDIHEHKWKLKSAKGRLKAALATKEYFERLLGDGE